MDLVEAAICAQYHDCVMYLLVHYPVLALRDDFLQFINNLFVHTRGCDWNYKKRYLSAMTTCISKVHSMRQPKLMFKLIQMCFQYCPRAAHDEVDCDGACRQLECKIALKTGTLDNLNSKTQTALELRVAAVKHLFQMIELHALPIELWIYESRMSRRDSLLDLHLLSECSRNEINLLIFLLYNLTVGSIPLFLQLLPVFKRRGFKLTASCLTTFIMNDYLVEYLDKALKLRSPDLQAVVHDRESPYRILLSELTRNCCLDGECWFRSYVLQDACARALLVGARIPLLMMLHLGVHDISPSSCNVRIGRSPIDLIERKADKLSPSIEFITHRYAPRFSRKMKMMAFGRVKFEHDDYNHSYFSEETTRYRAPEAPLRSLQELCRLSIRASLGHCRIEEKTEGLRDVLPQPLREYLYFRHDFLVFPEAVD
ncbi:uncharacterized protein LOC108666927 [Hyalella azteca]|uniref:Uncharacterized protein LOC108666927 n=1 Tax=Hyalella azteca TaxID=294128 RepID=A0A8B7N6Y4_HYAAZ|nr:uncharacterized protein LOC108666927 [Hyalella azteca]